MKDGIIPLVITPEKNGLYAQLKEDGIDVQALNYRAAVYPPTDNIKDVLLWFPRLCGRLFVNHLATKHLLDIAKTWKPDLIHTNVSIIGIGYAVAKAMQIPHIWHIREYGDKDFKYHYFGGKSAQLSRYKQKGSYTICITKDIQHYNELENEKSSKIIYNGVLNTEGYTNLVNRNCLLFVGRLENAKGFLELIDAYAIYRYQIDKPLPLIVAGEASSKDYREKTQRKIEENQLGDLIQLIGMQKDMPSLYRKAKAVIVSSHFEGFGRVTTEAMNEGCLVIGNNTAGTKEQFDNGVELTKEEIGLRYGTQEELVKQLVYVTKEPITTFKPMIERAHFVVQNKYTYQNNAKDVAAFYKQIVSK